MSDQKKDQKEDAAANAENAPSTIADEVLEDVEGGWSWGVTQPTLRRTNQVSITGSNFETIYGGAGNDDVMSRDFSSIINPDSMLKR